MGIDMSGFKMIYKDQVFNVLSASPFVEYEEGNVKLKHVEVIYINEDGKLNIVQDEIDCFRFLRK